MPAFVFTRLKYLIILYPRKQFCFPRSLLANEGRKKLKFYLFILYFFERIYKTMLKIKIDLKSFIHKGIKNQRDEFLIALVNGYQGSGKSFFAIYNVETIFDKKRTIYTNIHSYTSPKHNVKYFTRLTEIYDNHEQNAIFIIDELSKKFTKDSKIDKDFYSWLQQSRKHHRYVYMITQEYLQVPNWLRGVANLSYTTRKIPLTPIMITTLGRPVLDKETCEWGLQELVLRIYKRTKKIGILYDTYELINEL